jgi:hypothetical protein
LNNTSGQSSLHLHGKKRNTINEVRGPKSSTLGV